MEDHNGKLQGYEGCRRIDIDVSWDGCLKAIEDAMQQQPNQADEGYTVQELCSMFQMSDTKVKIYLRELIRLGRVYPKYVPRPAIDGRFRTVPVYILKKE